MTLTELQKGNIITEMHDLHKSIHGMHPPLGIYNMWKQMPIERLRAKHTAMKTEAGET